MEERVVEIVRNCKELSLKYFRSDLNETSFKSDFSPVSLADLEINKYLEKEIKKISDIEIVSEEGLHMLSDLFWCIDPLDGTKAFLKNLPHWTINVALVKQGRPVFGVVYAPVLDEIYYTLDGVAYFNDKILSVLEKTSDTTKILVSMSHLNEETEKFIKTIPGEVEITRMDSSLKICKVATGEYDIYPRFTGSNNWDIAAAEAILIASGGILLDEDNKVIDYSKQLLNPDFVCYSRNLIS